MRIPVLRSDKGFTIIEFMISVFLLTVSLFGLLTTLNFAMSSNMETKMRNDAALLAEERIARARNTDYAALADLAAVNQPRSVLVGNAAVNYTVTTTVNAVGGVNSNTSTVSVDVTWPYKGVIRNYNVATTVTNPNI